MESWSSPDEGARKGVPDRCESVHEVPAASESTMNGRS